MRTGRNPDFPDVFAPSGPRFNYVLIGLNLRHGRDTNLYKSLLHWTRLEYIEDQRFNLTLVPLRTKTENESVDRSRMFNLMYWHVCYLPYSILMAFFIYLRTCRVFLMRPSLRLSRSRCRKKGIFMDFYSRFKYDPPPPPRPLIGVVIDKNQFHGKN